MAPPQRFSRRLAGVSGKQKMYQKPSSGEKALMSLSNLKGFSIISMENSVHLKYLKDHRLERPMRVSNIAAFVTPEKVSTYIRMICHHANAILGRCVCVYRDDSSNAESFSAQEFDSLRYIFFVHRLLKSSSTVLTVISPRNKTVDFLSSISPEDSRADFAGPLRNLKWVWRFIEKSIGSEFVPSEWSLRLGASPVESPSQNNSSLFVCTNAMCIAFGYPLEFPVDLPLDHQKSIEIIQNRTERMAFDLHHGKFESEGTPSDPFYYEVIDRCNMETRSRDGFQEINSPYGMDMKIFARTRKYERFNWKDMTKWCLARKNAGKYEEHEWWRRHARNLQEYKDCVMERDYYIKTKKFVVGKGLLMWGPKQDDQQTFRAPKDWNRYRTGSNIPLIELEAPQEKENYLQFRGLAFRIGILKEYEARKAE